MFSGGLGKLNIKPVSIELTENAKPYHIRQPFNIPHIYMGTTKREIDRLCSIEVIEKNSDSEWACGTFITPKKTGDVRVVTDLRELNKFVKRKPFPLPKIKDLLQSLANFQYATAVDLSMGYYNIPLDKFAQELCTFLLPWGKYRWKRLPMGLKTAPDIFQEIMVNLLGDLPYVQVYIDDVLILTDGSYEDHLKKVRTVLDRLEKANFRARVNKCMFASQETEYLGYYLTRKGIIPQPKKVEAILRLVAPTSKRQLRRFLGMVNYYRDMWQKRSHILAPLSKLCSPKSKFIWEEEQQKAFEHI